jgi:hypothetical protein
MKQCAAAGIINDYELVYGLFRGDIDTQQRNNSSRLFVVISIACAMPVLGCQWPVIVDLWIYTRFLAWKTVHQVVSIGLAIELLDSK